MDMDPPLVREKVRILSEEFTIVAQTDGETVRDLAKMVEERMEELREAIPGATTVRLAMLCALNLADELHQVRRELVSLGSEVVDPVVVERTQRLISLLEEGIIGDIYP